MIDKSKVLHHHWQSCAIDELNCINIRFEQPCNPVPYYRNLPQNTRDVVSTKNICTTNMQKIQKYFEQESFTNTKQANFKPIIWKDIWLKLSSCILQLINIGAGSQIDYPTHDKTVQSESKIKILHTSYILKCYKLQKFQLNTANK